MATLSTYRTKRRFNVTKEPRGKVGKHGNAFVVHKHDARRLHYDLRLQLDGVMKSWAVTRGPSLVPGERRLAVQVEDHPIAYNKFEGTIPRGEYGAGTVMVWDRGTWRPDDDPRKGLAKGHLSFHLAGKKLRGGWQLVRMRRRSGEKRDNWLLIKQHDDDARTERDRDILAERPLSVKTSRSMDEIARHKRMTQGRSKVWGKKSRRKAASPKRKKTKNTDRKAKRTKRR
jgi:bifunctional non-homologous end joining protein LigD